MHACFYIVILQIPTHFSLYQNKTIMMIMMMIIIINQPKVCSEHGGLITYLKREYTHNVRDLYKSSDIWEGLFIDVIHENTDKKITIGNINRPPQNNNSNPTIENFIQQINPINISKLWKENSHAIFTGDFNINLLEMNTRIKHQAYFD